MHLYTGTGDSGTTSLVGGKRVSKASARLEAYGTLDEFSAHLGLLATFKENPPFINTLFAVMQHRLFDIGAYLATDAPEGTKPAITTLTQVDVTEIEGAIDTLESQVPAAKNFVLPGGTRTAAEANIARTVCRRAERRIIALAAKSYVDPMVIRYINRISDLLFILSRYYNHAAGIPEVLWQPRQR